MCFQNLWINLLIPQILVRKATDLLSTMQTNFCSDISPFRWGMFQGTQDNEEYLYKNQNPRLLSYNEDIHLEGSAQKHAICLYAKISYRAFSFTLFQHSSQFQTIFKFHLFRAKVIYYLHHRQKCLTAKI